jgi:hypothetical protein
MSGAVAGIGVGTAPLIGGGNATAQQKERRGRHDGHYQQGPHGLV